MGLFSGVSKAVSKVTSSAKDLANKAFNPKEWVNMAKGVSNSSLGKMGMEAVGSYFGYPGLGSAVAGALGGGADGQYDWGDLTSLLGAGVDIYSAKAIAGKQREQSLADFREMYGLQRQAIESQNQTAERIANNANLMSRANAREQMDFQRSMQNEQAAYNRQSIQNQMDYETRMANSAHQREVADLRAAGLNPILSGTGGMGAPTPSVSAGQISAPSGAMGQTFTAPVRSTGDAITSAMDAFRAMGEAFKAQAATDFMKGPQTTLSYAQSQAAGAAAQTSITQAELNRVRVGLTEAQQRNLNQEFNNLQVINTNLKATGLLTLSQRRQVEQTTKNLAEQWKGLKMRGDIDASEYGKLMELGKRATDVAGIGELTGALKSILGKKK